MDELEKTVEQYLDICPKPVVNAFLRTVKGIKATAGYCNCDGVVDPTCVWDDAYEGSVDECVCGSQGVKKHECEHWVTL